MNRCEWCGTDALYVRYHDDEWGVPCHNDQKLFEMLILEGAQAGLSWLTILRKRENYRKALDQFQFEKIATYQDDDFMRLMGDPGIVRNRLKITSTIQNAKNVMEIIDTFGSFDDYIWRFVDHKPLTNTWKSVKDVPAHTAHSDAMGKDLKKRGFNFVGTTICYSFMQAVGMVNDHTVNCFRYEQIKGMY
ncbi:MAG: DNA-3-methyladenine glycosylase I [Proteobacteria bacterium]|nr:DNA-3-methyladenine glycosylase I [Pseudomonadota bacterium]